MDSPHRLLQYMSGIAEAEMVQPPPQGLDLESTEKAGNRGCLPFTSFGVGCSKVKYGSTGGTQDL